MAALQKGVLKTSISEAQNSPDWRDPGRDQQGTDFFNEILREADGRSRRAGRKHESFRRKAAHHQKTSAIARAPKRINSAAKYSLSCAARRPRTTTTKIVFERGDRVSRDGRSVPTATPSPQ